MTRANQSRREMLRAMTGFAGLAALPTIAGCKGSEKQVGSPTQILLRGGQCFVGGDKAGLAAVDLLVSEGKIIEIGPDLGSRFQNARVVDASGKIVLPGGIDPHVHLTPPWLDDFDSGSKCALAGGITSLGNMLFGVPGEPLDACLRRFSKKVERFANADFFFHPVVKAPYLPNLHQLQRIKKQGHTSLKMFTLRPDFEDHFESYSTLLSQMAELQMTALFHCEDFRTLQSSTQKLYSQNKRSLQYFAQSRPEEAEVIAVRRAVELCKRSGASVYIVHLSSARALAECQQAMADGLPITVETRPLYLHLTEDVYKEADSQKYIGMPPIRKLHDQAKLWEGIADGSVHTVGSDHAAWPKEKKLDKRLTIDNSRPGINNLQHMLPMLFSEGVHRGRITLEQFVNVTATNAARIFGMYPQKGTIAVGSDADLAVWDPNKTKKIRNQDVLSKSGYSAYAGREVTGWPDTVLRRGEIMFEDDALVKHTGKGVVISRI